MEKLMGNYILKLILINFSGINDINILNTEFDDSSDYFKYIGCEFDIKTIEFFNLQIKFQIWNLSPKFGDIIDFYLIGSMGAIILFDHNNIDSFMKTMSFIEKLWSINGRDTIPITLIGLNPLSTIDKSFEPIDQIQEVIDQFVGPSNNLRLRYIPYSENFELLYDKLLFYFVDHYIFSNHLYIKKNNHYKKNFVAKLKFNRIKLTNIQNREKIHGIACVMDRTKRDFESIRGWVLCNHCGVYICSSCIEYLISDNYYYCPGSIYGKKHELTPLTIY